MYGRAGWICVLSAFSASVSMAGGDLGVLTENRQIQKLSIVEANKSYPVDIRGVVTFVGGAGDMFLQDESAGVFVFSAHSQADKPLHSGDEVRVRGITTAADYSPSITKAQIELLGPGTMPEPLRIPMDPLIAGRQDARWVEVSGVPRSGQIKGGILFLSVASPGGATFLMVTDHFGPDWSHELIDARITVRGVLAAIFNERRQSIAFRVFVPGMSFVHFDSAAPRDPFGLPLSTALSVGEFHPTGDSDRRIHIRGTLLARESQGRMFVADEKGSLQIEGDSSCALTPGDFIDVAGFPAALDSRPGLEDSVCRRLGTGPRRGAATVTAMQVIPPQVHNDASGYGIAAGTRYDLKPITIEGSLLQSSPGVDGETWSLADDGQTFLAVLPKGDAKSSIAEVGARFRLTGICVLTYDHYHRAQFFRVLVRNPLDVAMVASSPWRNLKYAAWTVCALIVMCLMALTWGSALKRQVRQQTLELREANGTLRRLSSVDALTGTGNRRQFDEALGDEVARTRRSRSTLSLLMIDIDFFKAVNDVMGHQKGDACLMEIAQALKSVVRRGTDLVCRYGGEEFAVILPGTTGEDARRLAEQIRKTVFGLGIPHPSSAFASVTVSIGAATIGPDAADMDPGVVVAAADRALYQAKRLGRNQVTSFDATSGAEKYALPGLRCSA